jgi:flagellar hook-associated protein 1 FlgK
VSLFSGLNTANTALWANQRAMAVVGQNVANANTDGYSRQRVNFQSIGGSVTPAIWSVSDQAGQGVDADDVQRIRDALLEAQAQTAHSATASLTVQSATYSQVEQGFGEPGDTGIQALMSNMWAGWGDVANNPTDSNLGARTQLLQRTATLVDGIHSASAALTEQWSQSHDSLSALVSDVNGSLTQIATLNQAIIGATQSGMNANDLADKRDALVLKLSDQIGATSRPMPDGSLTVSVGGSTLVAGTHALQLALGGTTDPSTLTTTPAPTSPGQPPQLVTVPGGTPLAVGGTADGQLATMTSILPGYLSQLNGIAQQLADQVNTAHEAGYDLNGDKGGPMFDTGVAGQTTGVTAANIHLAITDPAKLAAAAVDPASAGGTLQADGTWSVVSTDNSNADAMYQHRLDVTGTDSTYRQMIVALGVQSATASGNLATQSAVSTQVDASRESVSGVNIDDEMTNMIQFQHGYAAAGKLVSVINDMLDTVINMVG